MDSVSVLPDSVLRVVQRWNPASDPGRQVAAETSSGTRIYVVGPPRCGREDVARMFNASDACSTVTREVDADVVLLVVDAASVIGREDLLLLDDAAESGIPVVVALTRIDVYRDWQAVRRRDAEILASHCTAFAQAPVVPIAPGQEQSLVAVVSRAAREREAGGSDSGVIAQTRRMIEIEIRNLRDSVPGAELRAERSQLLADRDGRRGERLVQVRSRLQRARGDLSQQIAEATRATVAGARAWVDAASRAELGSVPTRLQHEVDHHTRVFDAAMAAAVEVAGTIGYMPSPRIPEGPPRRQRGNEDRVTILVGASAGLGLGRIAVTPLEMIPALEFASIPVTLVLGGAAAWWLARTRGLTADRAYSRSWIVESMSTVRAQWEQRVQSVLLEAEADLGAAIMAESREQVASAQARIVEIDGELRELAAARSGQLASCERDLAVLNAAY
ncbi:hypothetical protein [Rhodococcus erythropolis]|jgi:signal recognition particle receptor subunit beta|uniref:hypothetical protein n=1 Tax=Rhodococcus erythropolis TaxID=1833 RepID=UPI003F668531